MSGMPDPWAALVTSEGVPAEDIERIKAGILALAAAAAPRYCLHPNQVTEYRTQCGPWRHLLRGRRWRLVRGGPIGVYVMSCPDCPARACQLDMGGKFEALMAPWLLDPHAHPTHRRHHEGDTVATGPDHYREAERLLRKSEGQELELAAQTIAAAQTHATLALAAATALNSGKHGMPYADNSAWQNTAGSRG